MTAPRRYGIDATPVLGLRTGIGRFTYDLIRHLVPLLGEDETLVLCARTFRMNPLTGVSHEPLFELASSPRAEVVRQIVPARAASLLGKWFPRLHLDAEAGPLDVFHGTNFALPRSRRARGVVTIHDLGFLRHPSHVPPEFGAEFTRIARHAARRADVVTADSEHTRADVIELLGVPPEKVRTIHPGVGPAFLAPAAPEADRETAARYGIAGPYVLFVGTTHPRKNVPRLLEAFALARSRARLPHRLVIVGDAGFGRTAVLDAWDRTGLGSVVAFVEHVPDEDLPALYRAAAALAFPSLYEGFGFPVVEAFASGCPVLTSDVSSLPEVAGDAAVLADPASTESIADGLARVLTDDALRARLVEAGRARAASFRWDDAAARHLDLYRELAAKGS